MDQKMTSSPQSSSANESVIAALNAISVTTDLIEEELKPHLDTLLLGASERKRSIAKQVVKSGILPVLAQALRRKSFLTVQTVRLVAELAREDPVRDSCFEAGIMSALLTLLLSEEQDLLLYASQAIGTICYDSSLQQERLLRLGAVPRLVAVLLHHGENQALVSSCLLALCCLADMGMDDGSRLVWERSSIFHKGELLFRGTSQHALGFVSAVTMVWLKQWPQGQYSVSVEVVQRYSVPLWDIPSRHRTGWNLHLGCCPKLYNVLKYSIRNIPKRRSLKIAVFHTFL